MSPKKTRPDELLERIREALLELGLRVMADELDREVQTGPTDDDTRLQFLWRLLEPQLRYRRERAVERRIKAARFPANKTLDEFDFDFQPALDRNRVIELASLDFVRRGQNLLVAGMSGTGKSHICIAIGHLACVAGYRTRYTTSADMLQKLNASLATNSLIDAIKPYVRPELLVLDEVGLDHPERETNRDAQLFYRVVRARYDAARSTAITSNIDWEDWGGTLGDDVATVAILDRLIHHGHLITIKGPSYRAAEHSRLNSAAEPDPEMEH